MHAIYRVLVMYWFWCFTHLSVDCTYNAAELFGVAVEYVSAQIWINNKKKTVHTRNAGQRYVTPTARRDIISYLGWGLLSALWQLPHLHKNVTAKNQNDMTVFKYLCSCHHAPTHKYIYTSSVLCISVCFFCTFCLLNLISMQLLVSTMSKYRLDNGFTSS